MSALEFIWDASQEGRISELEDQVKELQEQMAMAARWINYLREEHERKNTRGVDDLTGPDVGPEETS